MFPSSVAAVYDGGGKPTLLIGDKADPDAHFVCSLAMTWLRGPALMPNNGKRSSAGSARFWPGTLHDEDVSIEVRKHCLCDSPELIHRSFDKLNTAFRRELIKLAAIFYFEDPPRFLANTSFVVVN